MVPWMACKNASSRSVTWPSAPPVGEESRIDCNSSKPKVCLDRLQDVRKIAGTAFRNMRKRCPEPCHHAAVLLDKRNRLVDAPSNDLGFRRERGLRQGEFLEASLFSLSAGPPGVGTILYPPGHSRSAGRIPCRTVLASCRQATPYRLARTTRCRPGANAHVDPISGHLFGDRRVVCPLVDIAGAQVSFQLPMVVSGFPAAGLAISVKPL